MPDLKHDFSVAPSSVNMKRSTFAMPYNHMTTANFGDLVPFECTEVLPGDTWKCDTRVFARMTTPLYPVMDSAYLSYYYFFVPNRLVWSAFPEFLGENKLSAWAISVEKVLPHAKIQSQPGSVADHFGIPTYSSDSATLSKYGLTTQPSLDVQFLPFRMYQLIWNEWFRSENVTNPILVNTGDTVLSGEISFAQGSLLKAEKPFDMMTACLPSPQKGVAVDLPLGGLSPIVYTGMAYPTTSYSHALMLKAASTIGAVGDAYHLDIAVGSNQSQGKVGYDVSSQEVSGDHVDLELDGMFADNSTVANASTINQLRQAFQMQRMLELQARSGTRYTEIIRSSFGVISPDARLQRPEYLGGTKVQIQMMQVAQTSSTDSVSPLGHVGAYSKTVSVNHDFVFSATEHGYIIGVAVARHALSYQQGLERHWSRRGRWDLFWPTFSHLGEQPLYKKQIFATGKIGVGATDDEVFGYNEAWIEYRCKLNTISGAFRSTLATNLDEWHYAEDYTTVPTLSSSWLHASAANVDRTLAVPSTTHDQLLLDFRVDYIATRCMPLYSIPGMIDHF